ncbi:glycine betaine/proline transport system ATP-binding protein [Phyllobacterium ifriqiyense]|uniref:Glycine betaine/proline transport system ATP-binding protein n=1 Tax=Phyllobacterium ifriqiyense TaxID=314238 RepID=A0ABU0S7A7_9HYPH|nr:choline ABC transporter ATP-binding protein [Phyllobacterium ifriqiyense]MDQ0996637.1 glycine betaine/proline transport system ATP-binding protein [Phyllobacterium ifriqiyense]
MTAITLDQVCIIFGKRTDASLALADQGKSRSEIQAETGHVLGVHNCSLTIAEGEILVLMGLSGSGKSTLLRAINRLNPISRGSVVVHNDGQSIDVGKADKTTLRNLRKHLVSMVFQQFGLLPWRTVEENVGFGLELSGVPKEERARAVQQQLELVNLKDWAKRKVGELSGGMQQRVGLARAFATGAPILLMDEPFSALDPLIRNRLQDELLSLQDRLKKTIVFVSHDLDEAMKIGNRIAIMEGGRIIQCGTAQDILLNPADDYVADFVANMNPLGVLTAADIMVPLDRSRGDRPFAATARPDTPVRDVMQAVAKNSGDVGVVEKGAILGMISADDIVRGLLKHQKK